MTVADRRWLRQAIELSRKCPPSATAFSVGAIVVSTSGAVLATGFSRENGPKDHAEEVALARAAAGAGGALPLAGATIYSSLEPCGSRASRPRACAELITEAGVRRVVMGWLEPPLFAPGGGARWLRDHGVTVLAVPELAGLARAVNGHLLPG